MPATQTPFRKRIHPHSPAVRSVAGHDTSRERFPGVLNAWNETIEASGKYEPTRRCRTIAWARKKA